MADGCVVYKLNHTTRTKVAGFLNDVAQTLATKEVVVVLINGDAVLTLTEGGGVTIDGDSLGFSYVVTAANLTSDLAMTGPGQVRTIINIYNSDSSIFMDGSGTVEVDY
jgi:hypothetical protein